MPDQPAAPSTAVPTTEAGAVLLIEDNRADALLIQAMLAEAGDIGYPILHAARLDAGLELLQRTRVVLILLDLSLPDSYGLATFQALQHHADGIPIIVLTGARDRDLALRAIQAGAQDYLVKDEVNAAALSKAIHYAVERKQAEMRLRESESRYKTLVNSVTDAILLLRDGVIRHCNERAADFFGQPASVLLGTRLATLSPLRQPDGSESEAAFAAHLQQQERGAMHSFEWLFLSAERGPVATEVILDAVVLDGEAQTLVIIRDLSDRKEAERRIRFQASLLDQVHNAVLATDVEGRIVYWNRRAAQLCLWPAELARGRLFTELIVPEADRTRLEEIRQALKSDHTWEGEVELMRRDGSTFPAILSLSTVLDEEGRFAGYVGIASDITERKQVERKLEHNAFHDALTGLPNRILFNDRLAHTIARSAREGSRYAVMMLDLDRFKVINDSLGHLIGDELLVQFSRRVESCLRPQDTLARLGGDEFTILLEDLHHSSDAIRVAERIHEKMTQPFLLGGHEIYTSASIGIAFGNPGYKEPAQAVRDADIAMYRAKNQGKGCHVVFESGMHERAVSQLKRENRLRQALEKQELTVHFQPIIDLGNGRCVGAEALLRWRASDEAAPLPTAEQLQLAEDSGLIIPIGQQVLDQACQALQSWRRALPLTDDFVIHINLSARQFCHRELTRQIEQTLHRYHLHGPSLALEIREGVLRDQPTTAGTLLSELQELKVNICLDDFGTGHSPLNYLHQFPLDILKIDRSLTAGLGTSGTSNAIIEAIIGLSQSFGMQTIAAGVESEHHRRHLLALGCRYAQGFLFQRPLSQTAMLDFLRTNSGMLRH